MPRKRLCQADVIVLAQPNSKHTLAGTSPRLDAEQIRTEANGNGNKKEALFTEASFLSKITNKTFRYS